MNDYARFIFSFVVIFGIYFEEFQCLNSARFLVIGDWGGLPIAPYDTPREEDISALMDKITRANGADFTLALGDNFYTEGVGNVTDKRFFETFESVFSAKSLYMPWFFVAGNHDHHGNVSAEIEYSKQSKRWNYPNFYYNLRFDIPGSQSSIEIVMIDTVLLCGNTDDFTYDPPPGPGNAAQADKQWQWIEQKLAASRSDYLLVAGHYPVYSIAEHGPTDCLVNKLLPLLLKYRVTAYLCGHDHNMQHLKISKHGRDLNFILSGAANYMNYSKEHKYSVPNGSLKFHWADGQFGGLAYTEVTPGNMTYIYYRTDGKELYRTTMSPRKPLL